MEKNLTLKLPVADFDLNSAVDSDFHYRYFVLLLKTNSIKAPL